VLKGKNEKGRWGARPFPPSGTPLVVRTARSGLNQPNRSAYRGTRSATITRPDRESNVGAANRVAPHLPVWNYTHIA